MADEEDRAGGPSAAWVRGGRYESLTSELTEELDRDQPAAAASVVAEWALWGRDDVDPEYRVLRCSAGALTAGDFREIITRYASGVKEQLPQYTVCWVPDMDGRERFLGVAIHELADADPRLSGGRSRTARGRATEYVRLFCVRYNELAVHGVTYAELVEGVRGCQLADGSTAPIVVALPAEARSSGIATADRELAEQVATLLLTSAPVCVVDAGEVSAAQRLAFIDLVMSLLPYGLRASMSASTWASPTVQGLKLRLFFSDARRDDERTRHVLWGNPGQPGLSAEAESARQYLSWLRRAGADAAAVLVRETSPVRFSPEEIRHIVATLPADSSLADIMEELAEGMRHSDRIVIKEVVGRLKRFRRGTPPVGRDAIRELIDRYKLLRHHNGLHPSAEASVYRALLRLALRVPLTYAGYCWIEECVGGPPHRTLRAEMMRLHCDSYLPWILTCKADPDVDDTALMRLLHDQGFPPDDLLNELEQAKETVRPEHWATVYDFAVRYLRGYAADPRTELVRRGYLAELLRFAFPRDRNAQETRLDDTIGFVFGQQLSDAQVTELFRDIGSRSTPALEAVVARRAAVSNVRPFVAEQPDHARTGNREHRGGIGSPRSGRQRHSGSPHRRPGPMPMLIVVLVLALCALVVLLLLATGAMRA
jgi:hypothetical protein